MGRIVVVGLGPAGPEFVTAAARRAIDTVPVERRYLRTARHPSAPVVGGATSFDEVYERADRFDEVYAEITRRLLDAARRDGADLVYAVPGSPFVLERTVQHLRQAAAEGRVALDVVPGMSFLDLAYGRLGIDPVEAGVRLVDGHEFAQAAAGERGPLLVAHAHARHVLSDIKLAAEDEPPDTPVVVLHHLGLPDEAVFEVAWADLDRAFEPDHLTALYVPELQAPVGRELVRFHELVRTLRERCPWDREQTHRSLTRHLVEETYELVEALDALDEAAGEGVEHVAEELGDVLFQVVFHSVIAEQAGAFTLADVARGIHDKLVARHPHVFGDVTATDAEQVLANWEELKRAEKGGASVMDGVPGNLPALLYALKLLKKAASIGFDWPRGDTDGPLAKVAEELGELTEAVASQDRTHVAEELGDVLLAVVAVARSLDLDPESALRSAGGKFRDRVRRLEHLAAERGSDLRSVGPDAILGLWAEVKQAGG